MKKIPSLFVRDYTSGLVTAQVTPACEWVTSGEGVPTEKLDGTACLVRDGKLYRRYDCKSGKTPPPEWEPCEPAPDPVTKHWPGWLPVTGDNGDKWHLRAYEPARPLRDGTYELCGPHFQSNPYGLIDDVFYAHGGMRLRFDGPINFATVRNYLETWPQAEGIVWHHRDGRMCKIKRRDFGLEWPPRKP